MRRKNEETMRRERTQLQNEVDILNQKLSQELLALKEELKGMFDDRKMSVRMDQSTMESKVYDYLLISRICLTEILRFKSSTIK